MSGLTFRHARRDPGPGRLMRTVLDPVGRPKTAVRTAIALAGTAAFVVAFAFSANATRPAPTAAGSAARAPLISGPDGALPSVGRLRTLPAVPALARAPRRHHRKAPAKAVAVATAVPRAPVATAVPVAAPPARKPTAAGKVFDTSG